MTGLLKQKYHVAILDDDENFIATAVSSLKSFYNKRIVIRTYKDSKSMFEAINSNKAKDCPFDLAVLSPREYAERPIIRHSKPEMKILVCNDCNKLQEETSKLLL
jgi:hypothetical protein